MIQEERTQQSALDNLGQLAPKSSPAAGRRHQFHSGGQSIELPRSDIGRIDRLLHQRRDIRWLPLIPYVIVGVFITVWIFSILADDFVVIFPFADLSLVVGCPLLKIWWKQLVNNHHQYWDGKVFLCQIENHVF